MFTFITGPTCKECGSVMVPKDGRYSCVNCGTVADCPPEPEPRVKRQRETIAPIPRKDDYAPKPPMTPADIRVYWERNAPQALGFEAELICAHPMYQGISTLAEEPKAKRKRKR